MAKVAVILSGCGVFDGAEIHESTLTLYFLDELGAEVTCFAPARDQYHVVNHKSGDTVYDEKRNIFIESSRIARGNIKPLTDIKVTDFDAIIFPGGFGAAKNFCDYALKGKDFNVQEDIANLILSAHSEGKILGFICITPVLAAKLIQGATVTVGLASDTSKHIEELGGIHKECYVNKVVWDEANNLISTPAYMLGESIKDVGDGIRLLCQEVLVRCKDKVRIL